MLEGCWLQLQAENVPNAGRMRVLFPTTIIRDTHMRSISTRQRDSSAHLLVVRGWMWTILVLGFFGTLATASAEFIKVNFVDKGGNLPGLELPRRNRTTQPVAATSRLFSTRPKNLGRRRSWTQVQQSLSLPVQLSCRR